MKSPGNTREWRHPIKKFLSSWCAPHFLSFPCTLPFPPWISSPFSEDFSFCFILRLWIQSEKGVCNGPFSMVM